MIKILYRESIKYKFCNQELSIKIVLTFYILDISLYVEP